MKTFIFLSIVLFTIQFGYTQVGINTTMPDAQLQIKSSNQATPANNDGLLIPKIDAFPLVNPTVAQNSMMVYLTTLSAGKQPGFYYWDNGSTSWKDFGGTASNWTLTGANLANNNTGNVGIGTGAAAPSSLLTVKKDGIGFTQEDVSGVNKIGFFTNTGNAWLQTHTNTDLSFTTNNGLTQMILQKGTGNLGINVINPTEKLEVGGKTKTTNLQVTTGAALNNLLVSDAVGNATWQSPNTTLNSFAWKTTGNSGTNPANNIIGTTDNQPIYFRANNLPAGRIDPFALTGSIYLGGDCGPLVGGSIYNVGIGYSSLKNLTTGLLNVGIGVETLKDNTSGNYNLAIGANALERNTTGINNTAIGYGAFTYNKTGSGAVAIGRFAMDNANDTSIAFDSKNVAIGFESLKGSSIPANNTGNDNNAIGYQTLANNTSGGSNIAIGTSSLYTNTTGFSNTAIGNEALFSNTTGNGNAAIGLKSLNKNTTGTDNTATGYFALLNNTIGFSNTANGVFALRENTSGNNNTANGKSALYSNTTGINNTASGRSALFYYSTADNNVAVGVEALRGSTIPANNTGGNNTAVGYQTLLKNTIGDQNVATGAFALGSNTSGGGNTAIGSGALYLNDIGGVNVANGLQTLYSNTSGSQNVANGSQALYSNLTGIGNIAYGTFGLNDNKTGNYNTAIGGSALYNNVSGSNNVAIGNKAGYYVTGSNKLYIENSDSTTPLIYGEFDNDLIRINGNLRVNSTTVSGEELQIKNSSLFIHPQDANINFGAGNGATFMTSTQDSSFLAETSGVFGNTNNVTIWSPGSGNRLLRIVDEDFWIDNNGNPYDFAAEKAYIDGNGQYFQVSDQNKKENIAKIENATEKINQISGYTYQFKLAASEIEKGDKPIKSSGVLAQEVEKILPEAVQKNDNGDYFVDYAAITPLLIEALKEQNIKIKSLENINIEILKRLEKLENK